MSYRWGYDPYSEIARTYGAIHLPTTVLIPPEGRVAVKRTGPLSERELLREIASHFQITEARI